MIVFHVFFKQNEPRQAMLDPIGDMDIEGGLGLSQRTAPERPLRQTEDTRCPILIKSRPDEGGLLQNPLEQNKY